VGSSGDEAEEEFLVSDYFFISYETGEPFWNPFKPPF
jgi:hypothetical protein